MSRNSLRSADFHCSVFWGTPLFVLKHDDRSGEIAPLDACQVALLRIDLHEDLYKAKNISVCTRKEWKMKSSLSHSEQTPMHPAFTFQRYAFAACIVLAPLSITLYLISWPGNLRQPLIASAMAGSTGNTLHLIGAIAASFFLPLGYLGMSLLGMRRAPWLATISAALSLVGWIPWAALMGLDALAYDIGRTGSTPQLIALWTNFNGDTV